MSKEKIDKVKVGDTILFPSMSRSIQGEEARERLGMPCGLIFGENLEGKVTNKIRYTRKNVQWQPDIDGYQVTIEFLKNEDFSKHPFITEYNFGDEVEVVDNSDK